MTIHKIEKIMCWSFKFIGRFIFKTNVRKTEVISSCFDFETKLQTSLQDIYSNTYRLYAYINGKVFQTCVNSVGEFEEGVPATHLRHGMTGRGG